MSRRVRLSVAHLRIEGATQGEMTSVDFVIPDNSTVVGVDIKTKSYPPLDTHSVDLDLQVSIVTDLGPSN